jgi:hypothetical protein
MRSFTTGKLIIASVAVLCKQAAVGRGLGEPALKSLGQLRSLAVLKRYLDPERHLGSPSARRRL